MKKLYTILAVTFLLSLFAGLHWSFANDKLPKETLPVSRPKPVYKAPFKPLPFKTLLPNVELYEFNPKAYAFDKIVGLQPILVGKDWQAVTNDPVKFTLTPSKPTAMLGEEIELTLTAELLDISPRLLFTLEELRNYSIKVILPQDFIQTGGTYLNFATGMLDPANPKHTYTIKGRYLDKPALDDCFKVLRKLNDEVFILKNTTCINVTDVDVVSIAPETIKEVREVTTGIDLSKLKFLVYVWDNVNYRTVQTLTENNDATYNVQCLGNDKNLDFGLVYEGENPIGSRKYEVYINGVKDREQPCEKRFLDGGPSIRIQSNVSKYAVKMIVYSDTTCSNSIYTKTIEITIDRTTPCPTNTPNKLTIATNETSLCPGASTTLTATTNCPAISISWQKDGAAYGGNGASTTVSTSGTYKAVCNSPAMISNIITVSVSNTPTVPNISTNRHSITPGEFATLTATNCQGTVVWQGPNNFTDTGDEISVGKRGNYQALCRSNCNGTVYYSDLSAIVSISLLPLRLEADKYEKYSNETAQISAFGCNNGYISWKINGETLPQSDNPLTAYLAGTYSAQCRSFSGTESDWVALYISEKTSTIPRVTASKTHAYPTDNVTLSASGCPSGWYYKWEIPVRASDNSVTYQYPVGTPQTVQGPATYKVQCILNDQNQSAYESVTVNTLDIGQVIINILANKTEANIGEPVVFTVTGNCPNGGGIRWMINGMNYWSYVGETFTGTGPGTYAARCESGPQVSPTVYYTVKPPKPGGVSIVSDKTKAKDNELVTLRAIGCDNEVIWTLPDNTEVRGSSILFNFGPGLYKAKCVNKFGFTSDPASLTIANRNWDEPSLIQTNTSVAINQLGEMQIQGCPNDWVQWAIPRKDANGNEVKDGNGQTIYDYTGGKILIFKGPGVYKVRCSTGDYSYNFQNIVVQAAPTNALFLKASRNVAKPDESVTITAYGCPNGTITWKNGNLTATGTQITVTGPGVRMAKCTGDYSNNGDWALAQIRNDGNITPYLNASVYEACPNQPVNITAIGCPNGWWYQTRWIKPDKLDYWLANRNAPIWEVYNYGGSNETKNGPNLYSARCISPDGSWMGDFDEKSITVEPAFPDDLRATNNGPAMVGDASVRLAVTEVPDASYAWTGPNAFASGLRNPEITALTAAKSGIYTVTLNKGTGHAWECAVTATTEVLINDCSDLKIKSTNFITSIESYELPTTNIADPNKFDPLVLTVINSKGNQVQNIDFRWKNPLGEDIGLLDMVQVRVDGLYTVNLSNTSFVCNLAVKIGEISFHEQLDWVYYPLNKTNITTGFLYDRVLPIAKLTTFNSTINTSDVNHFEQSYSELQKSSYNEGMLLNQKIYDNVVKSYNIRKKIPIGLICAKFNVFLDNALTNGALVKKNEQLYDSNNGNSPYITKNAYVASPLKEKVVTGINTFTFAPQTYINNTGLVLNKLIVNFGDGIPIANLNVGDEISINYSTPGQKNIAFTIEFTNGTTQTTFSTLKVESFAQAAVPDYEEVFSATIPFTPYIPEAFSNSNGVGQVGYYYNRVNGVPNTNLNKVAIVLDGFDPGDSRNFQILYRDKMTYGNNQNIIEDLKQDGYDVLVLNFPSYVIGTDANGHGVVRDGGADYVERNGLVLVELIQKVKQQLLASGSAEKIIIIGPSMGGLISRYALTYMEKNNLDHRCKLWVSFDSPHRGANINIADQLMFEYLHRSLGWAGQIKSAVSDLNSVAAQQMLLHHSTAILEPQLTTPFVPDLEIIAGSPIFRQRFVDVMNNMGFPSSSCIRNVALINGTDLGVIQSSEPGFPTPLSCSQSLNLTIGFAPSTFVFQLLFGNSGPNSITLTNYNSPSYNNRCKVFDSNLISPIFASKKYSRFVKGDGISNSLDIISGGYYAVNDDIPTVRLPIIGITKNFSKQSFIPTYSSMAISPIVGNIDWGSNLSYYRNNPTSGTPFKKIYAPSINEEHVLITSQGVNFIKEQIPLSTCN